VATDLSPTNPYTTIIPLTIVFCITMVKQGIEDYKRHRADTIMNNRRATVRAMSRLLLLLSLTFLVRVRRDGGGVRGVRCWAALLTAGSCANRLSAVAPRS
jgi:hypothetical protein